MSRFLSGLLLALAAAFSVGLHAQEVEPNNPCPDAQDLGSPALPSSVFGQLDSTPETPDVDFFRFSLEPGQTLQADLEGSTTNQGSLGDPFLGLFDSTCSRTGFDDDGGISVNSRLLFEVPADGVVILAVSNCCDIDFIGGGLGSYRLSLSRFEAVGSIGGRIVDGNSGEALPGFDFPYANAQLLRCDAVFGCFEFVSYQQADGEGRFLFTTDQSGNLLPAGSYQVLAQASSYENLYTGQFEVAEGAEFDLGDLQLTPFQLIGSISGRAIDAVTGDPVVGSVAIYLERCDGDSCYITVGTLPGPDGSFTFEGPLYSIPPGTFRLRGVAEDYREAVSEQFDVGAFEHIDRGDFPLTPFPIQFGAVQECRIPPGGGLCEYGIEVINRGPGRYKGQVWSTVDVYTPGALRNTRFQVGNVGATNPMPQRINLKQGQSTQARFRLEVPATVLDGAIVCGTVTVGRDPAPQFDSQGDRFVFCSVKESGSFESMSAKEGHRFYRGLGKDGRPLGNRNR